MYSTNNLYKAPADLLDRLKKLFIALTVGKERYEKAAAVIEDKALKRSIIWLAQESNQYARELAGQIKSLGGSLGKTENVAPEVDVNNDLSFDKGEDEIMEFCEHYESEMINTYRDILNEPVLLNGLRNLIRYQFNGLLCAFQQLKLMNASLHRLHPH